MLSPALIFVCAAALTLIYTAADRGWGDDWSFKGEKAAILASTIFVACTAGFVLQQKAGALAGLGVAVVWFIQRTLGFGLIGDHIDPQTWDARLATLARHALPVPFVAVVFYWAGLDWRLALLTFAVYALGATLLASAYGLHTLRAEREGYEGDPDVNLIVELARGALWGAMAAGALIYQP